MSRFSIVPLSAALLVTLAALAVWFSTGGDWYTKYTVVQEVEVPVDPDDPLAAAGFYDGSTTTTAEVRDEFHLGLLPAPQGLIDKHMLSVTSVMVPAWAVAGFLVWRRRRRA